MAKAESTMRSGSVEGLNIDFMRSLVKQYSELGLWTSALFWADAAAATGSAINGSASGDDVWLLASAMLAQGELHRAAYAITSRGLHRRHLLCLGVAMRAYLQAKEPETALSLMEECDPALLEPRTTDQTHNRALAGVLVWQGRALGGVERREAGLAACRAALRADPACLDALAVLYQHHALTRAQEAELIESLAINSHLKPAEATLLRTAYNERLDRPPPTQTECLLFQEVEVARCRTTEAGINRARRLVNNCEWKSALKELDAIDPWCAPELRVACLVELKKSSELFSFAHTLVDAYPSNWTSWFAVGCYYYLIGKNEFARRYLSKAKSLEPSAGCVWLAYGHSFAADNEHDQAMAAYFKASQLMSGSHLPPLYVGVECSLLNNVSMCEKFLTRAAILHNSQESDVEEESEKSVGWERVLSVVAEPGVAHEAGAAAYSAGDYGAAHRLWLRALAALPAGVQVYCQQTDVQEGRKSVGWERVLSVVAEPGVAHEAGAAAYSAGDYGAAHRLWLRALAALPAGVQVYCQQTDVQEGRKSVGWERVLSVVAEPGVAHEAGAAAYSAGDYGAAHRLWLRALAALPADVQVYCQQTDVQEGRKSVGWERVLSVVAEPGVAHEAGAAAYSAGDYGAAHRLWLRALAALPADVQVYCQQTDVQEGRKSVGWERVLSVVAEPGVAHEAGAAAYSAGDYGAAHRLWLRALAALPADVQVYCQQTDVQEGRKSVGWERVLSVVAEPGVAHEAGAAAYSAGDYGAAHRLWLRALAALPADVQVYCQQTDVQEGRKSVGWERVLSVVAEPGVAHEAGAAAYSAGDYGAAHRLWLRALAALPADVQVYCQQTDVQEGRKSVGWERVLSVVAEPGVAHEAGAAAYSAGDYGAAHRLWLRALAALPADVQVYCQQTDVQEGRKSVGWERVLSVVAEPGVAHEAGAAAYSAGDYGAAHRLWLRALAALPADVQVYCQQTDVQEGRKSVGWERVLSVVAEPGVAHEAGAAAYSAGDYGAAHRLWLRALAALPADVQVYCQQTDVQEGRKSVGWERVLSVVAEPGVAHEAGAAAYSAGDYGAAHRLWLRALAALPADVQVYCQQTDVQEGRKSVGWERVLSVVAEPGVAHEAGAAAYSAGDYGAAHRLWLRALAALPADVQVYCQQTDVQEGRKSVGWERVLSVVAEPGVAHEAGAAAYSAGDYGAAHRLWLRALAALPADVQVYCQQTDVQEGRKSVGWERVLSVVAEPGVAHEAGAAAYSAGDYGAAHRLWLRALAALPADVQVYCQQTDVQEGRKSVGWERVLSVVAEPGVAHEAGAAAYSAGDYGAAHRLWLRALAALPADVQVYCQQTDVQEGRKSVGWERVLSVVAEPGVAHEAGAAAYSAGDYGAAHRLWLRALAALPADVQRTESRWAATLDALGHAARRLGRAREALAWHERALALRPRRPATQAARALALALAGRHADAALALHGALHADPGDVVALALLDVVLYRLDAALSEEEIPTFPFPAVSLSLPAPATPAARHTADVTNTSDMSMSFD